jgi:hypothetical protein
VSTTAFQSTVIATAATPPPSGIAFTAAAHSYTASATVASGASVTAPATIAVGDTELLFVSTSTANSTSAPAGWSVVLLQTATPLQVTAYSHLVTAADIGAKVTVPVTATTGVALELVDYDGVGSVTATGGIDSSTATHTTPIGNVTVAGSYVVSYWTDKSSTTTAWTLPAAVSSRDVNIGTGGGRASDAIGDSGAGIAAGTYPAQTATVTGGASGKGAMMALLLAPSA